MVGGGDHLSGSSPCTSPKHPVSCIKHRLAIRFLHDSIHVSMPFSLIIPPSPSPSDSKSPLYTSVSLLLSRIQGHHYHLSKFHIYVLVYCIGDFSFLFYNGMQLIYKVVLVSGVQQSDSVIYTHISLLFKILFPFRLLQNIEQSSLCCTVSLCWLSILNRAVCQSQAS